MSASSYPFSGVISVRQGGERVLPYMSPDVTDMSPNFVNNINIVTCSDISDIIIE